MFAASLVIGHRVSGSQAIYMTHRLSSIPEDIGANIKQYEYNLT